ncbi:hypothetical protein M427DRAFT_27920 [Gonapodya prolifera JEL478]|uniref:Uncharacterized protein n=1 Tax=Gonapodya prolifera (strain JEL478) TaxID=1344416 RepID=A0A139AW74_GONPJ|nr:hypothetical protein M427DRAFT_27920 [Gonapodya prolifera JEL478]|eukprot:KXS20833.1 hypothetical protein M427DRAFT_27920 [Gonapodya prolifera JEL478]
MAVAPLQGQTSRCNVAARRTKSSARWDSASLTWCMCEYMIHGLNAGGNGPVPFETGWIRVDEDYAYRLFDTSRNEPVQDLFGDTVGREGDAQVHAHIQ